MSRLSVSLAAGLLASFASPVAGDGLCSLWLHQEQSSDQPVRANQLKPFVFDWQIVADNPRPEDIRARCNLRATLEGEPVRGVKMTHRVVTFYDANRFAVIPVPDKKIKTDRDGRVSVSFDDVIPAEDWEGLFAQGQESELYGYVRFYFGGGRSVDRVVGGCSLFVAPPECPRNDRTLCLDTRKDLQALQIDVSAIPGARVLHGPNSDSLELANGQVWKPLIRDKLWTYVLKPEDPNVDFFEALEDFGRSVKITDPETGRVLPASWGFHFDGQTIDALELEQALQESLNYGL